MKKAIILSAGQGSRLGHLTDDRPKCLIEFNGRSLLDRQLDTLAANGVEEAVVVTGFRDDQIEEAIARRGSMGPSVRTVYNPFYKVADNLGSLFVARDEPGEAALEHLHEPRDEGCGEGGAGEGEDVGEAGAEFPGHVYLRGMAATADSAAARPAL